ncbi:hypothetical protein MRB53_015823 [Persea americana]|uniref:Uncharacterized protein n=1 Tax=Persea americana TaxID=3435 RepID=A0ACC2M0A5_PERAE|nr:hypothetical protein MRB53_015823 [Persea americana]
MGILFGGIQARGEETWTPSSASFPEDLNTRMPSPPPHIDNTQNNAQETFEDISTEELMTNARRKRPCPSRSRRDVRKNQIDENFEHLVIILEDDRKEEGRKREEHKEEEQKEEKRKKEERKEEARKEEERKRGLELCAAIPSREEEQQEDVPPPRIVASAINTIEEQRQIPEAGSVFQICRSWGHRKTKDCPCGSVRTVVAETATREESTEDPNLVAVLY